jgi:iron(III) transport system ATP-binding protein
MNLLEIQSLSKTYRGGNRPAVHDASFASSPGEIISLVGESGSGKTTLLRLIAGLESPDEGTITLGDRIISAPGRGIQPEKRGIGMVFQHHALFPHLTVEKNISYGIRKLPRAERVETVRSLLELVGLPGFGRRYPHQLSGGERQRVALARALAPKPQLLLLDEPFASLDAGLREELREETRSVLKRHGSSAVFVTHDTADALTVADRIVVLNKGTIQQIGSPADIYGRPANAYVASFFGACNFLPPGQLATGGHIGPGPETEGLWLRPKSLTLVKSGEGIPGVITTVRFRGTHHEVILACSCENHGAFTIQLHQPGDQPVTVGDTWLITHR